MRPKSHDFGYFVSSPGDSRYSGILPVEFLSDLLAIPILGTVGTVASPLSQLRRTIFSHALLCIALLFASCVIAAEPEPVLIFTNRSTLPIRTEVHTPKPSKFAIQLEPEELTSIPFREGAALQATQPGLPALPLLPNTIYVFSDADMGQGWVCKPVALAAPPNWRLLQRPQHPLLAAQAPAADPKENNVIKVVLAVDDDELTAKPVWEKRYRQRIAAASQVLEYHTGLKLEVVAQTTWVTSNRITDFEKSLAEFEQTVRPDGPTDLVIGFTSQYDLKRGRIHLGGTRGLFATHILLREGSKQMSEVEKLEVLVHELGHYLGANHSSYDNSVMRPILGDRQAREKRFRILYDPLNALAINLVAAEYRANHVRRRVELSDATREKLMAIYAEQTREFPEDPSTKAMLTAIGAVTK